MGEVPGASSESESARLTAGKSSSFSSAEGEDELE